MKILNKVMFVDDDIYINEYHKRFAEKIDLAREILIYHTGEEAIDYLKSIKNKSEFPELILVDVNMPGMDGHHFVAQVNELATFNPIRNMIAFLTSSRNTSDIVKANERNIEYYYLKPLNEALMKKLLLEGFGIDLEKERQS